MGDHNDNMDRSLQRTNEKNKQTWRLPRPSKTNHDILTPRAAPWATYNPQSHWTHDIAISTRPSPIQLILNRPRHRGIGAKITISSSAYAAALTAPSCPSLGTFDTSFRSGNDFRSPLTLDLRGVLQELYPRSRTCQQSRGRKHLGTGHLPPPNAIWISLSLPTRAVTVKDW
jgi:hypothetical protein